MEEYSLYAPDILPPWSSCTHTPMKSSEGQPTIISTTTYFKVAVHFLNYCSYSLRSSTASIYTSPDHGLSNAAKFLRRLIPLLITVRSLPCSRGICPFAPPQVRAWHQNGTFAPSKLEERCITYATTLGGVRRIQEFSTTNRIHCRRSVAGTIDHRMPLEMNSP
jgi:hypothetical protein